MAISRIETSVSRVNNDETYGNGSDGDVTISGTITLTSDKYYNNLTIPLGNVLITNGFRVFVKNTAIINGVIGIGSVSGNSNGSTNGTISSPGSSVSTGTVAGHTSSTISYRIGGQGGGSTNPNITALPSYLISRIEAATGVVFDATYASSSALVLSGGSKGTIGSTGASTPALTNSDTWPGKAGSAGSNGTHPTVGTTVGVPGGKGATGSDGTATGATPGPGGAGGAGGNGGALVAIIAKNISGTGTVMSLGMSGAAGSAGTAGSPGTAGAAGAKAPDRTDHHHHSAVIHEPHTLHHYSHHNHVPAYHDKIVSHGAYHETLHNGHHHNHSATIHAPCCTVSPGHHWTGGAGGAGGAAAPAVTGATGKRGGAGGGGAIIIITEETPSGLSYDVRAGTTADLDTHSASNGSTYIILNK